MQNKIKGKFSVKSTPEISDETIQKVGAMRMKFEKVFEGFLSANSVVSMLGILDRNLGSGGYVAIERITGSIEGKSGSFCLQHSCTMTKGQQSQQITVIPDTGTEQLKGLSGQMTIEIAADGQHFYIFEFDLPSAM